MSRAAHVSAPRSRLGAWLRLCAIALINLFVALLWSGLLSWLIGRVLTDRFGWSQWLWWIPTPFALGAAVIGLVLAFRSASTHRRRRRRIVIWSVWTLALLMYGGMIEHRMLRLKSFTPPMADSPLTIAHWNMTLDNHADIPALLAQVDALDADVLSITSPPTEVRRLLRERAAAGNGTMHVLDAWPMLVVSRLPADPPRMVVSQNGSYIWLIEVDARARVGRELTIMLIDLPSNPRLERMAKARELRAMLNDRDIIPPDIAIGDFNLTRGSASLDILLPGMVDAFNTAGRGYGATFPRRWPLYHIDCTLLRSDSDLRAIGYQISDPGQGRHRAQKTWIMRAQ